MTLMKNFTHILDRQSARLRQLGEPSLFRMMSAAERRDARQLAFESALAVVG